MSRIVPGGVVVVAALTVPELSVGAGDLGGGEQFDDPALPPPTLKQTPSARLGAARTRPELAGMRYAPLVDLEPAPVFTLTAAMAVPDESLPNGPLPGAEPREAMPMAASLPVETAPPTALVRPPVIPATISAPALAEAATGIAPLSSAPAPVSLPPLSLPAAATLAAAPVAVAGVEAPAARNQAAPALAAAPAREVAAPAPAPAPVAAPARIAAISAAPPAGRRAEVMAVAEQSAAVQTAPAPAPAQVSAPQPATATLAAALRPAPPPPQQSAGLRAPVAPAAALMVPAPARKAAPAARPAPAPAPAPAPVAASVPAQAPPPAVAAVPQTRPVLSTPAAAGNSPFPLDIKSQLITRVDGKTAGALDFRQTPEGLKVRLGSVVEVLADRFAPDEIARIRASSSGNAYVALAELQAKGIPISYDPVYDEFNVGLTDTRPKSARKVHMDQISAPERGIDATGMAQVPRPR